MSGEKGKKPIKRVKSDSKTINTTIDAKKPVKKPKNNIILNKKKIVYPILGIIIIVLIMMFINIISKPSLERIKDSVVMLEVYDENDELLATGSGFCAYKSNYIVTNFHVIEGASSIVIITDDKEEYEVNNILIFDAENDLAILDAAIELRPLKFGNTDRLKAGEKVTAIGSPLGELNTVSTGIVSNTENDSGIQISASISHGSSGGALFNKNNRLVGITYATLESSQNLNYAISIDYLDDLYNAYNDGEYELIEYDYHEICMSSYDGIEFESCESVDDYDYYSTEDMNTFSEITGHQNRYDYKMRESSWEFVYDDMSLSDRELALEYYEELLDTYFCESDCNIDTDIKNWDTNDFMINLNILEKEELAFVLVDLENYNSDDAKFYRVDDYPLEAAEKALILYLIGDRPWYRIHKNNKQDIFNYFEHLYISDFGAILEILGYEVRYNNDGTLTAWW